VESLSDQTGSGSPAVGSAPPLFSIVIVNWNGRADLAACLASLADVRSQVAEVLVVDNGSTDGSLELVRRDFPWAKLLAQEDNLGFAEGSNRGIAASRGRWVVLLNNDTTVEPEWLDRLARAAREAPADCGMLQTTLVFMDRPHVVNSTGIELTASGAGRARAEGSARTARSAEGAPSAVGGADAHGHERPFELEPIFCPTAGAAAYRRRMLDELQLPTGFFDRDHFMYYEDLDLGWRARLAGWSARLVPGAVVRHRYHASTARRSPDWLWSLASTNRIRTLLKNASWSFLLRNTPQILLDLVRFAHRMGPRSLFGVARAVAQSWPHRARVTEQVRVPRRRLERRWVVPD